MHGSCFARRGVSSKERFGDVTGALALVVGLVLGVWACRALLQAPESAGAFSLWLGSAVNRPHVLPTFDSVLLQLGHALFPWSAVLPVALGSLLREPPGCESGPAREREAALRLLCLILPVLALGAYGISAPVLGPMPFGAVSALAIAIALFVRDFERGAKVSRALPMVACAFAILLLVDFKNFAGERPECLLRERRAFPGQLSSRRRTLAERRHADLLRRVLLSAAGAIEPSRRAFPGR